MELVLGALTWEVSKVFLLILWPEAYEKGGKMVLQQNSAFLLFWGC